MVSAGLSAFFLGVYLAGQFLAASRSHVPSFYFSWERHIPFVAWLIVPYMSIDLFFVTAPLLIRSDRQLRGLAVRVLLAIAVAGICFAVMPLRFAFIRPAAGGPLGAFFELFRSADLPFNQLPSLHVALLLIVGEVFVRRTRGWVRGGLLVWFGLIGISPLLVYQHHLADLAAGLALGLICLVVVPDDGRRTARDSNHRVAGYYTAAAVGAIAASVWIGRSSWLLWWPAVSLSVVAAAYWFVGPSVYGKTAGRVGPAARVLLWPALMGQHASLGWYKRQCRPYDRLTDRLWIGRVLTESEATTARAAGVSAVIDLTCEFDQPRAFRTLEYLNLPTLDLTAPTPAQIDAAVEFVRRHGESGVVYVHCKVGYSRTAVVAGACLIALGRARSVPDAVAQLRAARPTIVIRPEALRALQKDRPRPGR